MNKFISLLVMVSIATASCNNTNQSATDNKTATELPSTDKISTYDLLQGKWQSLDDPAVFLVFEKNNRKEIVSGIEEQGEEFVLSDRCENSTDKESGITPENDKYISCNQSDMCWYIIELNASTLSLSYMGRGNTLNYKKVE